MSYEESTVAQLKAQLKARSLPVAGRKDELIKRLQDADAADVAPAADEDAAAAASADGDAAVAAAAAPPQANDDTAAAAAASSEEDPLAKRVARFGETVVPEADKVKKREERFGNADVVNDKGRQDARAARFGLETEATKQVSEEKRKADLVARSERFGIAAPELEEDRKKARVERFSKSAAEPAAAPPTLDELAGMINKRAK